MIATVNSSFLRRSGVRNALEKAESNFFLLREVTAGSGGRNRASVRTTDIPSWERTLTVLNACGQARSPHGQRAGTNAIKGMLPERPSGARASTPDKPYSSVVDPPAAASSSGPTSPPSGNSSASRSRFTTWNTTLLRGLFFKPFTFGRRMCRGICPPSNAAETFLREPVPLVPRPADLPLEPSPRPTRVFGVLAPGAGRRWWTLIAITRPPQHQRGGSRRRSCPESRDGPP